MVELPLKDYYRWMFLPGLLLLVLPSLVRAYFLMPFPGSQDTETMTLAYYVEGTLLLTRIIGALLVILPVINTYLNGTWKGRVGMSLLVILCAALFYASEHYFAAENMFREPITKRFANGAENKVEMDRMVVGVAIGSESKAYPINFIGYHHKVQDTIGGKPVLVTYCTMCRTARVYDPIVDGKYQHFRLVGARHYSAIIEDDETGSWWYQASGTAAIGPRRGSSLVELPSEQMTLAEWIAKYPSTTIMQPDPEFAEVYAGLKDYERYQTTKTGPETMTDGWQRGAWVVGVQTDGIAKAYRWSDLNRVNVINDEIGKIPIVIAVASDSLSFMCYSRICDDHALTFEPLPDRSGYRDSSGSVWNTAGHCISGPHQGKELRRIQAYQQYWHSWKQFHPLTAQWKS